MMKIQTETAHIENNRIILPSNDDEVREALLAGDICIFHDVFPQDLCLIAKKSAIEWAKNTPAHEPEKETPPSRIDNWHRYDNNPVKSQTPHIFHAYNFNNLMELPAPIQYPLQMLFQPMIDLQNRLAGTTGDLQNLEADHILHPQIVHYPVGGGYFGRHEHPFEPQKFGLIVSLSQKGEDFETGATLYYNDQEKALDLDDHQKCGSLTIFRYDIPHAVTVIDSDKDLNFDHISGRWSAILPYY